MECSRTKRTRSWNYSIISGATSTLFKNTVILGVAESEGWTEGPLRPWDVPFWAEKLRDHPREFPETELTPREITILKLVSMGLTNKQIADRLFLSAHTVITHRKNITTKLGIKTISGLTVYAILNNIVSVEEIRPLLSGNDG